MIRTHVQLTERQLEALRRATTDTNRSMSDLIREAVDHYLAGRCGRAIRLAGKFSSGLTDVSADHDRHLREAFSR